MNYTILVVTNEPFIAESYLESSLYKYKDIRLDVLKNIPVGDTPSYENGLNYLAIWEEHYNDLSADISYKFNNGVIDQTNAFDARLIKIPFEGLAYLVMRDRKIKGTYKRYIILTIKEKNPTQLDILNLYDFKLDGRHNLSLDKLDEYYEKYVENNVLLSDIFNPVENLVRTNKIPHLSEFIEFFK